MPNFHSTVSRRARRWAALPLGVLAFTAVAFASSAADKPLSQQTFIVVQASGVDAKKNDAFDIQKTLTLKKGQLLVLKSSSGQEIEVMGPYHGKPLDHYTPFPPSSTMGYDAKSFVQHGHCADVSGGSHPAGGPNPDETAGSEATPTHCH